MTGNLIMPMDIETEDEIHLREYLKVVLKRRRIVIAVFLGVLTVAMLVSLRSTPMYTAATRLKVEQKDGNPLGDIYGVTRQDPVFFNSQIQIISSQAVMEKVVKILDLTDAYLRFFPEAKAAGENKKEIAEQGSGTIHMPLAEKLARQLLEGLKIERVRDSQILKLTYTSRDPVFSALICNTLPRAYIEQLLEMKMINTEYTINWMEQKAAIEREKLEEAEHALQEYLVAQDIVTIENRITILPERLSLISTQLSTAEVRQKELEMIMAQIEQTPEKSLDSIPAIADDAALQAIRQQIRAAEQEILTLSQKYGSRHPVYIQAQSTLNELHLKKEQETGNIVQRLRNDLRLAVSNSSNLRQQMADVKAEAARLNEKSIQYNILKREIETKRQLYDALVARIKEQTMTKQIRDVDVYVVETAKTPARPSNQNLPKTFLIALVLGSLGGVGSAFLLEYMDNTISLNEDAEEKTGVKALAVIPFMKDEEKTPESVVKDHPASAEAENYKVVRTALSLSTAAGFPKTMMVTSVFPGDGKTLTCANLAIAIAQANRSVLLIDCDMRRPTMHKVLKKKSKNGFSEVLTGQIDKFKAVQATEVPNLRFIPAGSIPPNPSDLLSSEQAERIIAELAEKFDIIMFDTPPMASVSDSHVLAGYVEKILFVTRSGVTRYEDLIRTMSQLGEMTVKVVGQVVNAVDLERQRYYYPYYKYYHHYYTDDADQTKNEQPG